MGLSGREDPPDPVWRNGRALLVPAIAGELLLASVADRRPVLVRVGRWGHGGSGRLGHGNTLDAWFVPFVSCARTHYSAPLCSRCGVHTTKTVPSAMCVCVCAWCLAADAAPCLGRPKCLCLGCRLRGELIRTHSIIAPFKPLKI
jgi:hypothetical protein